MDFRLRDFFYPLAIVKKRRWLERTQRFDAASLKNIQLERAQELVTHCYEYVPYYRKLFKKIGFIPSDMRTLDDLKAIPVLTKEMIRQNAADLLATNARIFGPSLSHSGGTTGTALEFYVDRPSNIMEFAAVWRHWNWAGYRFGDRFCDLRGRIIKGKKPYVYDRRLNALFLSSYRMTPRLVREYAVAMRSFKPVIIRGYPSAIDVFAQFLCEEGIDDIRPKAVVTSSETLLAHQRKNVERAFGCVVFDTYGLEERSAAAGQCSYGRLHEDSEYGIISYEGPEHEMICTGLHNFAMPLIRYRTNDIGAPSSERCPCGRGLPVIASIIGRVEDMIRTPDGRYVAGSGLSVALKHSAGIKMSQIVQEKIDAMTIRVVRSAGYGDHDEQKLLAGLRDRVGEAIAIRVEYVDDIPLTAAGKLKFVVSKMPRTL